MAFCNSRNLFSEVLNLVLLCFSYIIYLKGAIWAAPRKLKKAHSKKDLFWVGNLGILLNTWQESIEVLWGQLSRF